MTALWSDCRATSIAGSRLGSFIARRSAEKNRCFALSKRDRAADKAWPLRVAPVSRSTTLARSEEHTSELQSLMRTSYAVFCLKKKKRNSKRQKPTDHYKTYKAKR